MMVPMKLPVIFLSFSVLSYALKFVEKEFQRPHLQVATDSGIVQGVKVKSDNVRKGYYYAFLGIPYAQPPLGELRFKAPNWVENWSGVLDGSREESKCIEILLEIEGTSEIIGSEDCLYLNVFTGTNPSKTKQLKPVMVFIHGGGFWFGSSDFKRLGPDFLVSKDVIVVTSNYRLSVFGFLSTEDEASPGNYGLKDQNLVLRWIQKNIKHFGGDPDNVLLFGHSAGAASTTFHMLSPKSRGLFHRVILQSGSALCPWTTQRKPRNIAYLLGVANGITNPRGSQDLVDKLRKIDIDDMKKTLLPVFASTPDRLVSEIHYSAISFFSNPTPVERRRKDVLGDLVWPVFSSTKKPQTTFLEINESMKISNISEHQDDMLWWDKLFQEYGNHPFHTY